MRNLSYKHLFLKKNAGATFTEGKGKQRIEGRQQGRINVEYILTPLVCMPTSRGWRHIGE